MPAATFHYRAVGADGTLLVPLAASIAAARGWQFVFLLAMGFNLVAAGLGLFVLKPMRVRHFAQTKAEVADSAARGGAPQQSAPSG